MISSAIYDRLCLAICENSAFHITVVLPLHPEGQYKSDKSVQAIMDYQYATICRGNSSLLMRLKELFPQADLKNYISFYSLRQYADLGDRFVTEEVFNTQQKKIF